MIKIADSVILSRAFMTDNENFIISHAIGIIDPEGPEKSNNTGMKSMRLFTAATQHTTFDVVCQGPSFYLTFLLDKKGHI